MRYLDDPFATVQLGSFDATGVGGLGEEDEHPSDASAQADLGSTVPLKRC